MDVSEDLDIFGTGGIVGGKGAGEMSEFERQRKILEDRG